MIVSVLSALARLDVDPWLEAAKLAQLPGETATQWPEFTSAVRAQTRRMEAVTRQT
jgi:heme oxygenase